VTNPSDPDQVVHFVTRTIPERQRTGLPKVMTDTAPAALEINGVVVLLFPGFIIVIPVSWFAWLSL
jgi:hypothetical protein